MSNIVILSCCYCMVFITAWRSKVNKAEQLVYDNGTLTGNPSFLLGAHLTGIFWLGLVPVIMLNKNTYQHLLSFTIPSINTILIFSIVFLFTTGIINKQGKNILSRINSSCENTGQLTKDFFIKYFTVRIVFLFCYELWFRGILLFDNINQLGSIPAIIINVLMYVILHIFKCKKEILACIPFGTATCCLSILFGNVWPAVILHVTVSLVYELPAYQTYSVTFLNKKS